MAKSVFGDTTLQNIKSQGLLYMKYYNLDEFPFTFQVSSFSFEKCFKLGATERPYRPRKHL